MPPKSFASALAQALVPPPVDVFKLLGFEPNPGPQTRFLELPDENIDVLYGGAAGGSKSTSLLLYALRACTRYPGLQAFWFRRTFPELQQSVLRMLARYQYGKPLGCRWNESKFELQWQSGSILTFGHAKNVQEASALLSAEINLLLIDERTTLPPPVVDLLYSRVRSGVAGVPCLGIRSATNPGEIGHARVKADYVEATGHGEHEIPSDKHGRRRIFLQARAVDTPQLGEEYRRSLEGLPEKFRKAYLEGDWNTFAGQMFPELSWDRHVIAPFTIPETWRKYVGVDWGFTNPWGVGWFAVDPDGRVILYRELYLREVGEAEQAKMILAAEADDEHIAVRWADDAMWAVRGDRDTAAPISQIYAQNGVHLTPAGKGPGSRVAGWQRIHTYLAEAPACPPHRAAGQETCPMFHAFSTCPNWFDELSNLPHATGGGNPEDSDPKAADHLADLTRYVLLNLGGGPEFVILGAAPAAPAAPATAAGIINAFGAEVLREIGGMARRDDPADPWATAGRGGFDDPPDRIARRAPWA
jgi:hypothetical protein